MTLKLAITSGYATPATGTNGSLTGDITNTGSITTGYAVLFGTGGPEQATGTTLTAPGYSQYFATQLQTTTAASAGDISQIFVQFRYDES